MRPVLSCDICHGTPATTHLGDGQVERTVLLLGRKSSFALVLMPIDEPVQAYDQVVDSLGR